MNQVDILINNYNYEQYIDEAIESVLAQTHKDWQLIVVDDGSIDGSRHIIERYASMDERIKPVFKQNGGQLSALNAGFARSSAPFVFFLDADDRYNPTYIERALQTYAQEPTCDFLGVAQHYFGAENRINILPDIGTGLCDLGFTAFITACVFTFIGERTSAVSMRHSLADRIFPIALEKDWRIQGDNCLIWMSSILGGRKFYLPEPLIDYRTHNNNHWYGKEKNEHQEHAFNLSTERFFGEIRLHHPYLFSHRHGPYWFARALLDEARTGTKPPWVLEHYIYTVEHLELGFFERRRIRRRFRRLMNSALERAARK